MVSDRFRQVLAQTSIEPIGLEIVDAAGVRVRTTDGKSYLDLTAGIGVANVGHGRPEIAQAVAEQLGRHAHVMVYGEYEQNAQTDLAAMLVYRADPAHRLRG
jgi:adenosylmethionine-8-amino-7-oxononanoate aminotransferase